MARSKRKNRNVYESLIARLSKNLDEDRVRLSTYLSRLVTVVGDEPEQIIVAADAVAKIGNALTQHNHLSVDVMKIVSKMVEDDDEGDLSDVDDEIGRPFKSQETKEN